MKLKAPPSMERPSVVRYMRLPLSKRADACARLNLDQGRVPVQHDVPLVETPGLDFRRQKADFHGDHWVRAPREMAADIIVVKLVHLAPVGVQVQKRLPYDE